MADINNIEKRLIKLEGRFEKLVVDANRLNEGIARVVGDLQKRFDRNLRDQNTVNAKAYKHVSALEKRFLKLDKSAKKMKKTADPKIMERNTMKLVDQALKAFDKSRGKR